MAKIFETYKEIERTEDLKKLEEIANRDLKAEGTTLGTRNMARDKIRKIKREKRN